MPFDAEPRREALPGLLDAMDDRPSLGALLSTNAMDEYHNGSHSQAHQLMRRAVATGHPSPACVDRLPIDLVKLGEKNDAATILRDALTRPIPSDSMRGQMTKRLSRCSTGLARTADTESPIEDRSDVLDPAAGARHLRPGENTVLTFRPWRAQIG